MDGLPTPSSFPFWFYFRKFLFVRHPESLYPFSSLEEWVSVASCWFHIHISCWLRSSSGRSARLLTHFPDEEAVAESGKVTCSSHPTTSQNAILLTWFPHFSCPRAPFCVTALLPFALLKTVEPQGEEA